ncbi:MAG: T9SS type A sorting domain-containing protein [Bacteroidetes bacterium]|nr:T9SS type A sorting domain-containing protein [Bacteroidota bacterium]
MKRTILKIKLLVLMLAIGTIAFGQYSGTYPNIAAFKTASVSDTVDLQGPELAVDTLLNTFGAVEGVAPAWLEVDLGAWYTIDGYGMILPDADELPTALSFEISVHGNWWTFLHETTVADLGDYGYDLNPYDSVRYVRFNITEMDPQVSFTEVMVYGDSMTAPTPPTAYAAENITFDGFTANWSVRSKASGYTLSIATDIDFDQPVPGYDNLDVGKLLSYEVSGLDPNATYYYAVRAYNISGTSTLSNRIEFSTPKAPQTITFDSLVAYTYGDADFGLEASSSSGLDITFTNSDESVALIADTTVTIIAPGTTTITASQDGSDQYFAADPVVWNLVVEKKELLIESAAAENKVYDGTTEATISGAVLTGVVESDDVNLVNHSAGAFVQTSVGTAIEVQTTMEVSGTDLDNYILPAIPVLSADITPGDLTVLAEDKSREECAANPEFTYTITGFAEGEDESVLTSNPAISCSADENSGTGSYDILVSSAAAANYTITFVAGTLTVTTDATLPELTVKDTTVQLSGNFVEITPIDVVVSASDNCSIKDTTLSQSIFTGNDVGIVAVEVTLKDAAGNRTTQISNVTVEGPDNIMDIEGYSTMLYPNPVEDILTIETENPGQMVVQISSLNGKIVHSFVLTSATHREDLSSLNNGVYFVTIKSQAQVRTMKIVKL